MRGYYVYKDIWIASVGEELPCQRENGNRADPFAVAVVKNGVTVGHIPRKISSVCSLFLRRNGVMTVLTTQRRRFSADLPQGGLEIPCVITFEGAGKEIQKVRKLVTAAMLPTASTSCADDIQQEEISVGENKSSDDTREWVQYVWWDHPYKPGQANSFRRTKANRSAHKLCPVLIAVAVS